MRIIIFLTQKPLLLIIAILAAAGIFIAAIADNAVLETDLNEYMPAKHPAFAFSDEAEALFGIEDSVLLAIEHPTTIFNPETLAKIEAISIDLPKAFEEIKKGSVTSLATADNITGSEWGLEVEPFFPNGIPQTDEELENLRAKVVSNEMVFSRVVSTDTAAALIVAQIDSSADTKDLQKRLTAYAEQWEGPETIYSAGRPIVEGALAELGPADMAIMFPLVMAVMVIVQLILLRSVRDTILNMVIVMMGTLTAFGAMALLGVPVYAVDTMIPVMLIAIGVAYGIHMHNSIRHIVRQRPDIPKNELIHSVLHAMIRPVSMAAVTTAIGFSALMTSQVLPVRYFGLFSSIGVLTEMVLALLLFPASIHLLGVPKHGKELSDEMIDEEPIANSGSKPAGAGVGGRWAAVILKHPLSITAAAVVILALGIIGMQKVWIDTSFLANFEEDSVIAATDRFVNTRFGGTSSLNIILTADEEQAFKNPDLLKAMDALQREIAEHETVGASFSLTDFIRRMNRVMHEDDETYSRIPDDQELIAQYLLLYEFSGDPETLETVVDYNYKTACMTFQMKSDSSSVMSEIIAGIEPWRGTFEEFDVSVEYAGSGYKAFVFSQLLLEGQIISLLLSFVIVALLLTALFRSLAIGLIGTIPIAVTAVVNFGVMGLFNVPLSSATALISSIAVGIGVDYAIHFIEHYRNRRIEGRTIEQAVYVTVSHTGRAIIWNALAVMGGFAVLMFSVFPPNRQVGSLIVLNMAVSALGTLSILPAAVIALDKRGRFLPRKKNQEPHTTIRQEDYNV